MSAEQYNRHPVKSAAWFHGGMRTHFPQCDSKSMVDTLLLQATRKMSLDVLAFDDWLHNQHKDYDDDKDSMKDVVRRHYGNDAVTFVESAI